MVNSSFQFSRPVLVKSEFQLNDDFKVEEGANIEMKIDASVDKSVDADSRTAMVALTLKIGAKDSNYPFFIDITEQAGFKWNENLDGVYEQLLNQNAPALLLGYIRQIVVELTAASPYSAYHLPFIDFTKN